MSPPVGNPRSGLDDESSRPRWPLAKRATFSQLRMAMPCPAAGVVAAISHTSPALGPAPRVHPQPMGTRVIFTFPIRDAKHPELS